MKTKKEIQKYQKEWYLKNHKRELERRRAYRENNKEKLKLKQKEYYKINKERYKKLGKEYRLQKKYGISLKERNKILKQQNGKCKICGLKFDENIKKCVDHSHKNEKVRGILCNSCNSGIGFLKNIKNLKSAIKYLEESNEIEIVNKKHFIKNTLSCFFEVNNED